jgi:hypothetical protein
VNDAVVRYGVALEKSLVADCGVYPEGHVVARYVQKVFEGLLTEEERQQGAYRLLITKGMKNANAFAFPQGTVVISDRMIRFAREREVLEFVLKHELTHLRRGHFEDLNRPGSSFEKHIMMHRLGEYEADARAAFDDREGKKAVNPYAGMVFFRRLHDELSSGRAGIVHGHDLWRLASLQFGASLVDSEAMSHRLTPIPEEIFASLEFGQPRSAVILKKPQDVYEQQRVQDERLQALEEAEAVLLRDVFPRFLRNYKGFQRRYETESAGQLLHWEEEVLATVVPLLDESFGFEGTAVPSREILKRALVRFCVLGVGPEDFEEAKHSGLKQLAKDFSEARYDPEALKDLPEIVADLNEEGLDVRHVPLDVCQELVRDAITEGCFDDEAETFDQRAYQSFLRDLSKAVECLCVESGVMTPPSAEVLFSMWLPLALESYPRDEQNGVLLAWLGSEGVSRGRLVGSLIAEALREDTAKKDMADQSSLTQVLDRVLAVASDVGDEDFLNEVKILKASLLSRTETDDLHEKTSVLFELSWENQASFYASMARLFSEYLEGQFQQIKMLEKDMVDHFASLETSVTSLWGEEAATGAHAFQLIKFFRDFAAVLQGDTQSSEGLDTLLGMDLYRNGIADLDLSQVLSLAWDFRDHPLEGQGFELREVRYSFRDDWLNRVVCEILLKALAEECPREEFFERLARVGPGNPREGFFGYFVVAAVLEVYEFDEEDPQHRDQLMTLMGVYPQLDMASEVQRRLIERDFETMSDDALRAVFFDDWRTQYSDLRVLIQRFVDERLTAPQDIQDATDQILNLGMGDGSEKAYREAAQLLFANEVLAYFFEKPRHRFKLLKWGLSTDRGDFEFRKKLFFLFYSYKEHVDDDVHIDGMISNLPLLIQQIYGLSPSAKRFLLFSLLIEEGGILLTKDGCFGLIHFLFDQVVAEASSDAEKASQDLARAAFLAVADECDPVILYFLMEPFLLPHFFRRPSVESGWGRVVRESIVQIKGLVEQDFADGDREESVRADPRHERAVLDEVDRTVEFYLNLLERDSSIRDMEWDRRMGSVASVRAQHLLAPYRSPQEDASSSRLTVPQMMRHIASRSWSPGIRLSQILMFYVDLSEEMERELAQVYDANEGQSKLSAALTLEREWGANGLLDTFSHIREAIGAGSKTTVWRTETENGDEVLRVLNPNAGFFNEEVCDLFLRAVRSLSDTYPQEVRLAEQAIGDIREWLRRDIYEEGYHERLGRFRDRHSDWVPGFDSRYTVTSYDFYGEPSTHVRREAFVEGHNLTERDVLEAEGHDLKEVLRVAFANFVYQVQTGLVHSNVTPGNIRVTPQNEVVFIDRDLLIELDERDQDLVRAVLQGNPLAVLPALAVYLRTLEDNQGFDELETVLSTAFFSSWNPEDPVQSLMQGLVAVRREDVHIPLKLTLMLFNLSAFHKMARQVGWEKGLLDLIQNLDS